MDAAGLPMLAGTMAIELGQVRCITAELCAGWEPASDQYDDDSCTVAALGLVSPRCAVCGQFVV